MSRGRNPNSPRLREIQQRIELHLNIIADIVGPEYSVSLVVCGRENPQLDFLVSQETEAKLITSLIGLKTQQKDN